MNLRNSSRRRDSLDENGAESRRAGGAHRAGARLVTTGLKRLHLLGNVEVQTVGATTHGGGITRAGHATVRIRGQSSSVGKDIAAPTFATILETSERETLSLAGSEAESGSHEAEAGLWPRESTVVVEVVSVASGRLVVGDDSGAGSIESRIRPDRESVLTTTSLSVVTSAWEGTLAIINLRAVDCITTVADTIVLETGISEAVTLTLSDTLLHCHLLLVLTRPVDQSGRGSNIVEATGGNKGLKRVQTRRQLNVPRRRGLHKGDGRGGDESSKRGHREFFFWVLLFLLT